MYSIWVRIDSSNTRVDAESTVLEVSTKQLWFNLKIRGYLNTSIIYGILYLLISNQSKPVLLPVSVFSLQCELMIEKEHSSYSQNRNSSKQC